jgi:hypothetical protein
MMNLFEIMQAAQGGNAIDNLARQFNLSGQQAQGAVEALLPAMQMGLQRQTESVDLFTQFLQTLSGGEHQQAFDADGDGIPDNAAQQGNDILGQLFGSKDVSRAVAAQASAATGLSDTILKSMLPVIASMMMGGLFKGMNNQGFGGLLGQIAGGMLQQPSNPMGDLLGQMMGGAAAQPQAQNNPFGSLLGSLFGGLFGGAPQQTQAANPMQAGLDTLTSMFQSGTQVQQNYQSGLQDIFASMLGQGRR